jgi:uncharacterized RDD family membrane protein YckC
MKCPKCDYLGFDTGDRCKNCGFDFSFMTAPPAATVPDLALRLPEDEAASSSAWLDQLDGALGDSQASECRSAGGDVPSQRASRRPPAYTPPARPVPAPAAVAAAAAAPAAAGIDLATAAHRPPMIVPDLSIEPPMPPPAFRGEPALPLFSPGTDDDQPLIRVPSAPRAPLSVRRTPDAPRLRAVARAVERPVPEPTLQFADEAELDLARPDPAPAPRPRRSLANATASSALARITAALLDHAMLLAIDATVLYLTVRLAGLTMADWRALPPLPLIAFLLLLKVAYFTAFTAVGGQTLGKMATGIRVVSDDADFVDPSHAVRRALAGVASLFTLGAAFVPALLGADGRALHDRVARTRVITLPSA